MDFDTLDTRKKDDKPCMDVVLSMAADGGVNIHIPPTVDISTLRATKEKGVPFVVALPTGLEGKRGQAKFPLKIKSGDKTKEYTFRLGTFNVYIS
jgi:hypothetical protein